MSADFWGVEVKSGETVKVNSEEEFSVHISQAALGEVKKDKANESVLLYVTVSGQKIVLGTLHHEKSPHIAFDLVFRGEFELSHTGKGASVYFCGYQQNEYEYDSEEDDEVEDEEQELAVPNAGNGKVENAKPAATKADAAKADAAKPESSTKPKAQLVEPKKDEETDEDDTSDDDDDDDNDDEDDDGLEGMSVDDDSDDDDESDGDDEDDESDSDDEETPKKPEVGKKRPNESAIKTPEASKKAKAATPQKMDAKKGGHTATPHPAKNAGKAAANGKQTPKSAGQFACNSCERSFGSENALQSHSKAKHAAK